MIVGQTISHYRILEKLGEGGMGVVYKAQDTKLDRFVALKFLPPHLDASKQENARFVHEAKAASALNHPNVCTIHDIAEENNQQFIVMEFVDGTTIKQKLPIQKLQDALTYALQIGDALHEAHSKGVVHRDIKCENIMVNSKNQIKVMDFGLARLKGSLKLTKTSSTVGTLAYMAPEQIQGGEVDARSDIFSFGVVLFEMLTGHMPFRGDHEASMMYSILQEEPESVQKHRQDIPVEVDRIIHRALEKDPEDRYQSVADMVSELKRVRKQSSNTTRTNAIEVSPTPGIPRDRSIKETPATSFRWNRTLIIGAIVLAVCALAVYAYVTFFGNQQMIDSLAVLPFVNASNDPEKEYLTEGITEHIINKMSGLSHLRVIPRSLVAHYGGKDVDPQQAGKEMNVRAVLTGKVAQRGDELSIQTELIDIQNVSQMWGEQYTKKMSDLISVEGDIIRNVSGRLATKASGEERRELVVSHTTNPEAYRLYLKGRFYWNKRTKESIQKALIYLQQAIDADPEYALAYSGIADCYLITAILSENSAEYLLKLKAAALKALELDSGLAEPHASLGQEKAYYEFDFPGAEQELRRAIALNPNYATAHHWLAFFLSYFRRFDESFAEYKKASDLDPLSLAISSDFGLAYYYSRQYDLAIEQLKKTIDMDPNFVRTHYYIMLPYLKKGMPDAAFEELIKGLTANGDSAETIERVKRAYSLSGFKGIAKLEIQRGRRFTNATTLTNVARSYLAAGDREGALHALEDEYAANKYFIITINADPFWDDLRAEPRFKTLMKKMGF